MVIVDSTVWIDYLTDTDNPRTRWIEARWGQETIGLTELILCEVLQGFRDDRKFEFALSQFRQLLILNTSGLDLAVEAAQNYRRLRAKGITVRKTIDCLIATFCIEHGHQLLHSDRDFDPFEIHLGLQVIHP
jgi:predicted nucleic acid-binding protein